ncbi:NAD-binding protein [Streptomyces sp. TG1A-8]|uniref:NAD-binding protein n=1 Tax=Streptomyces sp. TG1A-8 TaxID=3051385 RepID=UPI00265C57B9|nr:NAD-binding protein [Streptomyces sp. TG1A-8]MDO0924996.1 NAD-binding protein [Streptomyces sp. TG1A-8]
MAGEFVAEVEQTREQGTDAADVPLLFGTVRGTGTVAEALVHAERTARRLPDVAVTALAPHAGATVLTIRDGLGGVPVRVEVRPLADEPARTLEPLVPAAPGWQASVLAPPGESHRARALLDALHHHADVYSEAEADALWRSMPLLRRFADDDGTAPFSDWALIFRDHYVENSVGFLLAAERAGVQSRWIYALAKGDRTANRHRVHAWFVHRGYRSAVLDNSVVDGTCSPAEAAAAHRTATDVDDFIRRAHRDGRRVLVVDDGGLLAQGTSGRRMVSEPVDAALELTVSGLKRISAAPAVDLPVFNLARSEVKSVIAYNEIADSCLRRVRAIVPNQKFVGRRVLVTGYGTLGARLAQQLRATGCRVTVVDSDPLMLVQAAEHGFDTRRTVARALRDTRPFLIVSSAGEPVLHEDDLGLLPDGLLLAGFATKDFSLLHTGRAGAPAQPVPGLGVRYGLPNGRHVLMLGDGRSLNLFEYEGIPNRGYDAYRAATLIAARELCGNHAAYAPGVHVEPVNEAVRRAGLLDAYYDLYLQDDSSTDPAPAGGTAAQRDGGAA